MSEDTISRQAAIEKAETAAEFWSNADDFAEGVHAGYLLAANLIKALPSAERHGRWEAIDRDCRGYAITYECSSCKQLITLPYPMKWMDYDYCPNCGAKME